MESAFAVLRPLAVERGVAARFVDRPDFRAAFLDAFFADFLGDFFTTFLAGMGISVTIGTGALLGHPMPGRPRAEMKVFPCTGSPG